MQTETSLVSMQKRLKKYGGFNNEAYNEAKSATDREYYLRTPPRDVMAKTTKRDFEMFASEPDKRDGEKASAATGVGEYDPHHWGSKFMVTFFASPGRGKVDHHIYTYLYLLFSSAISAHQEEEVRVIMT